MKNLGFRHEEETKNEGRFMRKNGNDDCFRKNEKIMEDFFGNYKENLEQDDSDHELELKFKNSSEKNAMAWFYDEETREAEKLYSML